MLRTTLVKTRLGNVRLTSAGLKGEVVVALIHGALRDTRGMSVLAQGLEELDTVFAHLPGHNGAPVLSATGVRQFGEAFAAAIPAFCGDRQLVVVGESLGGLVAMSIANHKLPQLKAVVALDPFFSTGKLWPIHSLGAVSLPVAESVQFMWEVFGLSDESPQDRIYFDVLDKVRAPTIIVTGDVPLAPPRNLEQTPCLMDETDILRIHNQPLARLRRIAGGHQLLDEAPTECARIVREVVQAHTSWDGSE